MFLDLDHFNCKEVICIAEKSIETFCGSGLKRRGDEQDVTRRQVVLTKKQRRERFMSEHH